MVIKLFNIKSDKSKRLWIVILTAFTVASVLIGITMFNILGKNSEKLEINKKDKIFSASSYECEYNVSVVSNKTLNKYNFKEIYERRDDNTEIFKFKTKNEIGDEINYIVEENNLKISSNSQISEYILSDYVVRKTNLLSISTFVSLYNDIKDYVTDNNEEKGVKIQIDEIESKTSYKIIFEKLDDEILKEYADILNDRINIKKMELLVENETGKPLQYIVYNNEEKAFIDIEYIFFELNDSI